MLLMLLLGGLLFCKLLGTIPISSIPSQVIQERGEGGGSLSCFYALC
jgi:hypothetical protein